MQTHLPTHIPEHGSDASAGSCCGHVAANTVAASGTSPIHRMPASWSSAARVTLHCLTGCALGEWLGLAIGVSLGLATAYTIALAVTLAFVCGFALTLVPMLRRGLRFGEALRIVWLGELVSIAVMELVMNLVDYHLGGMGPGMSLRHPQYWLAFGVAALAGYLAALPVNYALLRRHLKHCH